MITTYKVPYRDGELRIGWASWDNGKYESRSIKYAYRDSSGKISRGSPELSFDVLVDMFLLADDQGELAESVTEAAARDVREVYQLSLAELRDERTVLSVALRRLQALMSEIQWAHWQPIHDQLDARLDALKHEISKRSR